MLFAQLLHQLTGRMAVAVNRAKKHHQNPFPAKIIAGAALITWFDCALCLNNAFHEGVLIQCQKGHDPITVFSVQKTIRLL